MRTSPQPPLWPNFSEVRHSSDRQNTPFSQHLAVYFVFLAEILITYHLLLFSGYKIFYFWKMGHVFWSLFYTAVHSRHPTKDYSCILGSSLTRKMCSGKKNWMFQFGTKIAFHIKCLKRDSPFQEAFSNSCEWPDKGFIQVPACRCWSRAEAVKAYIH